jgi:hypothetical protein
MNKHLSKQAFMPPSLDVARRIDDSDKCTALHAAAYRFDARLLELEQQFEAKASALRTAYLSEVATIHSDIEAA